MGDGTRENPYTREDVLRLIEERGGTAEGLDLSGKTFESGIDLSNLDLHGIILEKATLFRANLQQADLFRANLQQADLFYANLQQALLSSANLQQADLRRANLQKADISSANLQEADLSSANLQETDLWGANLRGAVLDDANLEGAYAREIKLSPETALETVRWGNYILGEERSGDFDSAPDAYRRLKQWYTNAGMYGIAGSFFFREMTARRKQMAWRPNPIHQIWSKFLSLICGYGERPLRVIGWAASVILGLALIYFLIGSVWEWSAFWRSLYFSAVSFTALGYGKWADMTSDWIRGLGAFESFIGVFSIALFLVTFTRKMTR